MRRLRAEHAALTTLAKILIDLIRAPAPPRPTELASVRGMLRDTLVRHLKCEDWALYPRLKMSGNPQLAQMAVEFVHEMGHIAEDFAVYDGKWTADRIAVDWAGFAARPRSSSTCWRCGWSARTRICIRSPIPSTPIRPDDRAVQGRIDTFQLSATRQS